MLILPVDGLCNLLVKRESERLPETTFKNLGAELCKLASARDIFHALAVAVDIGNIDTNIDEYLLDLAVLIVGNANHAILASLMVIGIAHLARDGRLDVGCVDESENVLSYFYISFHNLLSAWVILSFRSLISVCSMWSNPEESTTLPSMASTYTAYSSPATIMSTTS